MKTKLLILSCFLSLNLFAQDNCLVKIMTPEPNPSLTDAKFYLILKKDTIYSNNGVLKIDTKKYKKLMDEQVLILFSNPTVFNKLYKPFNPSLVKQSLSNLCGKTYFLQHN